MASLLCTIFILSLLYHLTLDELIDFDIDQKEIEEAIGVV